MITTPFFMLQMYLLVQWNPCPTWHPNLQLNQNYVLQILSLLIWINIFLIYEVTNLILCRSSQSMCPSTWPFVAQIPLKQSHTNSTSYHSYIWYLKLIIIHTLHTAPYHSHVKHAANTHFLFFTSFEWDTT